MDGLILAERFPHQFELLRKLFPKNHCTLQRIRRLDEILRVTEAKWEGNLQRLSGIKVKYLLIAEAPPWTGSGVVRYFYNTCNGPWVDRIWRTFFDFPKPTDPEKPLKRMAEIGFLLVDSLPFAENFSDRRSRKIYRQLVKSCSPLLLERINDTRIEWADDVRAALAFKLNGLAVMESLPDGIRFPTGQSIRLTNELICADGSGYTSPTLLRSVLGITEHGGTGD